MAEQHRATAGEWASVKSCADVVVTYSCILELLHRIEALEAKDEGDTEALAAMRKAGRSADLQIKALIRRIEALEAAQHAQPNHPAKPDSSLVERVAAVIENGTACDRASERIAGDTILAVAAWLQEQKSYGHGWAAITLEQEAER